MKKIITALLALSAAVGAYAQFSQAAVPLAFHEGVVLSTKYPAEWVISGFDMDGMTAYTFSPESGLVDPFDFLDISGSIDAGLPFAVIVTISPEMLKSLNEELGEGEDPLEGVYEELGEEIRTEKTGNVRIGRATGTLTTGLWGEDGSTAGYIVSARTASGGYLFFIGISPAEEADAWLETFRAMHGTVSVKDSVEGLQGGTAGYDRMSSSRLLIDYPRDWHPFWMETGFMQAAMFMPMQFSVDFFKSMDFPPTDAESIAMVAIASGEEAESLASPGLDDLFDNIIGGLGEDPKASQKAAAVLNKLQGKSMTVAFTDSEGVKKSAYVVISIDGTDAFYAFVGISTSQRFTADKKKFEVMAKSFSFKP
jgi:hypothetical protein